MSEMKIKLPAGWTKVDRLSIVRDGSGGLDKISIQYPRYPSGRITFGVMVNGRWIIDHPNRWIRDFYSFEAAMQAWEERARC